MYTMILVAEDSATDGTLSIHDMLSCRCHFTSLVRQTTLGLNIFISAFLSADFGLLY